jgi:hypothetical protein
VWQFPDSDLQDSALCLLEHIDFVEKSDVVQGFAALLEKKPDWKDALWVPLRPRTGKGKSADQIRYDLKEMNVEMLDTSSLTSDRIRSAKRIVFFDDLLNTGMQSSALIDSWFNETSSFPENPGDRDIDGTLGPDVKEALKEAKIDFAFYSTNPVGVTKLRATADAVGLQIGDISGRVDTSKPDYSLKGFTADGRASTERFLKYIKTEGTRLLREKYEGEPKKQYRIDSYALGFGGLGTTLLYRHSVSTALPVVLWEMSTNIIAPWIPVFPRKATDLLDELRGDSNLSKPDRADTDDLPNHPMGGEE